MTVDGLINPDVEAAREVVVLVARTGRRDPLEQRLEVAQQERLVFVDREAERRVQRLQMHAAVAQSGALHLVPDAIGDVDELCGVRGGELETVGRHRAASRDCWSRTRVAGAGCSDAAADDTDSIALANATCTSSGALSASNREPRARHRSPINSVVGGAARLPRPCSRTPTSISAAARASRCCTSGANRWTWSRYARYVSDRPSDQRS